MTQPEVKAADAHPPESSVKLNGPPGTGKTTQLLARLTDLLDSGYELSDITFVTYRTQMAEEFLIRLADQGYCSPEEVEEPWQHDTRHFGTLHGVCNRITPQAETVEDHHRRDFLWGEYMVCYDGRGEGGGRDVNAENVGEAVFDAYSWCVQNKQHSFPRAPNYKEIRDDWPGCPSFEEFDEAWSEYKQRGGNDEDCDLLQDFDDMLRSVDEGSLAAPGDVLIVDEYHDFTPIMASIAESWMDDKDTVIVGGDPLQAIYSYKGASPRFFTDLDLPEVLLDRTYRVPSDIWGYARSVIGHDVPDIQPDAEGGKVTAARGEPDAVVDKYGDGSVMYLARTQSQLYEVADSLKASGIIFRSQEGIGGWNHSTRRLNLYNALQKLSGVKPALKVNPNTGQSGLGRYDEEDVETGVTSPAMVTLTSEEASALVRFTPAEHFSDTKREFSTTVSAKSKLEGSDMSGYVEPTFWEALTQGAGSVDNLLSYDAKPTLRAALERNDEPVGSLSSPDVPDVLTIHAAKGREADTVALYDGIPPAVQRNIHNDERAQHAESRVWYVAVTRAAENLLVFRDEYHYCERYLPPITG